MPEGTLLVFVFNFGIGDRSEAFRAPVDDALATIDQALIIVLNKYVFNCFTAAFVHGESFVFPVTGRTDLLELLNDTSAVLLLPFPGTLEELVTPEVIFSKTLFLHRSNDPCFGRDGCVVGTRYPESIKTLHSLITDEDILKSVIQGMAHVELARDIRRRHDDTERILGCIARRSEISFVHPLRI